MGNIKDAYGKYIHQIIRQYSLSFIKISSNMTDFQYFGFVFGIRLFHKCDKSSLIKPKFCSTFHISIKSKR